MKELCVALIMITFSVSSIAKTANIVFTNHTKQSLTLKWIAFKKGVSIPDDDHLFESYSSMSDLFYNIRSEEPQKHAITSLPSNGMLLLVGIYTLGGRTDIIRKNLANLRDNEIVEFTFEKPEGLLNPSSNFDRFKDQLGKELFGEYTALIKTQILGSFLLVVNKPGNSLESVLPLIPELTLVNKTPAEKGTSIAEDIFSKSILTSLDLQLPGLPLAFNNAFGYKNYSYVRCEIESKKIDIVPSRGGYYDLFLTVGENERKLALEKFEDNPGTTKLLYIISASTIDNLKYSSVELRKLNYGTQLETGHILTGEANYEKLTQTSMLKELKNQVTDVNIRDFSDFLRSELAKRDKDRAEKALEQKNNSSLKEAYQKLVKLFPKILKNTNNTEEIRIELQKLDDSLLNPLSTQGKNSDLLTKDIEVLQNAIKN